MKGVIPYLLCAVIGALLCWGVLASKHSKAVDRWKADVAVEQARTLRADSLRVEAEARAREFAHWIDSVGKVPSVVPGLIAQRTLAQQETRRALDAAQTTSDSLTVVQKALAGAEGRELALLDTLRSRDQTIVGMREKALQQMAENRKVIGELTAERDRWKEIAQTAPVYIPSKGPSRTLVAALTAVVVLIAR